MVVIAWVMLELTGDRPVSVGDPIAMRGDNVAAVTWANMCGRAKRQEGMFTYDNARPPRNQGGWSDVAKHILGVQNTVADGISRWP